MKVIAPGKLILSGEHSVLYQKPALAMAVNRYAVAQTAMQKGPYVSFDLTDFSYQRCLNLTNLKKLKDRIKHKYARFMQSECKIREVLQKPVELAQFAFSLCLEMLNIKLSQGMKIHVQSEIPIGCGMGSSAATILSIVHALTAQLNLDLSTELLFQVGLEAENMQHGYSSGLDLRVSMQGGCLYIEDGLISQRAMPKASFYLVHTGIPQSITGECVAYVAAHFNKSAIWDEFAETTKTMDAALTQNNIPSIKAAISNNHQLLTQIGVVPESIQTFIREIEALGGSAKICGAGSIRGQRAGMVLVLIEDTVSLAHLCKRYGYTTLAIAGEERGVHVI